MKHFLFAITLFIVIFFALRVLYWALSSVLVLVVIALIIYIGARVLQGRRENRE